MIEEQHAIDEEVIIEEEDLGSTLYTSIRPSKLVKTLKSAFERLPQGTSSSSSSINGSSILSLFLLKFY